MLCIYKEFGLYEFGRWRQLFAMAVLFRWRKRTDDPESVVNGSYKHRLTFASYSLCF